MTTTSADQLGDEGLHHDAVVGAGVAQSFVGVVDQLDGALELGLGELA